MNLKDIFQEVWGAITSNKVRSGLTILGIVIGISSVIAMMAVGNGAKKSIEDSVRSMGSNLIIVMPSIPKVPNAVSLMSGDANSLNMSDVEAIESQVKNINGVAPEINRRLQVVAGRNNVNTQVIGTTPNYINLTNVKMGEGRFFTEGELNGGAKVAIVAATTRKNLFGSHPQDNIGDTILINKVEFKIVGLIKDRSTKEGFTAPDDRVIIPITAMQRFLAPEKYLSSINIQSAGDGLVMKKVQADIKDALMRSHRIRDEDKKDFEFINQAELLSQFSAISTTFTVLLSSIAGISLLVGGIGIMNMMLTSVTERTKEIGLRKAIGAKSRDIVRQFLVEAILLTLIGGLVGVLLGIGFANIITMTGVIKTSVTLSSVLISLGVSAMIGVIFGYYPARKAANMNPIQALKYE